MLYAILWYTSHLIGFVYGYIIFATLRRYFFLSPSELKDSLHRTQSSSEKSLRIDQFLAKANTADILHEVKDDLGPWVQLQLGDLAGFLEVLNNFYEWAAPRQTLNTLILFTILLMISLFGDMEVCVRTALFLIGICFFGSFPIASRYPKYRFLVSPLKWAFWNVPTNAEWAFAELRLAAQNKREDVIFHKIDTGDEDSDVFVSAGEEEIPGEDLLLGDSPLKGEDAVSAFEGRHGHRKARLEIVTEGIRLVVGGDVLMREWWQMKGLRKKGKGGIELEWGAGEKAEVDGLGHKRDQAFAEIIGGCPIYMRAKN